MHGNEPRKRASLPLRIIESGNASSDHGHDHSHDHSQANGAASQVRDVPPPCLLFVGDTAISEADIAREMQFHRAIRPEQSRANAARALVVRELLRREAVRLGVEDDFNADGGELAEEAGIQALLEREVPDRLPSEEDCRRYFEQNRARFRQPDQMRVRHILLAAPAEDVAERHRACAEAERMIGELQTAPELFADFALRHSQCPSSEQGGELGWLQRGQTTPEFDRQLFRLNAGLAPFPIESRWGYHVVCVDGIDVGKPLEFEQIHGQISDYLELQVRQQEVHHYLSTLYERYGVRGLDEIEAQAA